jgi:tetratricopeptide (TPR) repeat protein
MDVTELLQRVLAAEDKDERRALLEDHGPLDTAFFQKLKESVLEVAQEDGQKALRMADIGLEALALAEKQEGVACAWWTRGNALLFLGRHDDCLAAYSTAISLFARLGYVEEVAQLQTNCMTPLMWTGRYAEAQAMGQSALEVLRGRGDTLPVANLLLSLGVCTLHQGDHAGALEQIRQAAGIFTRLNEAVRAARSWVTQAVALECMDRFAEADSILRDALQVFSEHRKWVPWARGALNLGVLHARVADYQTALHWLEESRQAFLKAGIEMDAAVVDLYRAQCFLDINLLPEATTLSERLVEIFIHLSMPRQEARAASLLAEVYSRGGQRELALRALQRARQIFCDQGDKREVAMLDLQWAALLREMKRPGEASRLASEAAEALDVQHYPLRHAEAHLIVAACCEDLGLIEEAQVAYRVAWAAGSHPTGTTEPPPFLAYRVAHARGVIAEAVGDRALARGEYGRAVGFLVKTCQGLGLDELRGGYLADKRPVYEAALRLALEDGRLSDAFRYSELARAGALRDFLAGRHDPVPRRKGEDKAVLGEMKARWAWRVNTLHRPVDLMAEAEETSVEPKDRLARLRELANLERELADAYRRRRLADPRFAVLEQGEVLGLDTVQEHLPDRTALLIFEHLKDNLLVFVVTRDTADIASLGSLVQLRWDAARLGHALEEIRLFDDPSDLAMLGEDLKEDLQELYRSVLAEPLARLASEINRLLVVPCDVLHTLPLEAFHDGQQYLLERYTVCYLPSASLLTALPEKGALGVSEGHETNIVPSLVMAHSWEGRLPQILKEAEGVARVLESVSCGKPLLLTEEQATTEALRVHVRMAGLLHLAAHGDFRADAPLFSLLHLADGPLTVNEVYGLDLSRTVLVTLSGCQTGVGQGRGGEVLGLTHAFFFAGAAALVASRWRVDDEATAALMRNFYAALARGETVAEGLRTAQLSTLSDRPHAGYWSAFTVWGRGFDSIIP